MQNKKLQVERNRVLWRGIFVKRRSFMRWLLDLILDCEPEMYLEIKMSDGATDYPDGRPTKGRYKFYQSDGKFESVSYVVVG